MNGIRAGGMHASLYLLLLYFVFFNFNDRLCDDFSREKHVFLMINHQKW
jgi:hypothetical protein